jgi:hypothetical protein
MAGRAFATLLKPQQRRAKKTQSSGKKIKIPSRGTVLYPGNQGGAVKFQ